MKYNILIGGKAGQGANILAGIISKGLTSKGLFVFTSREYESMIRGGHNYNVITFSDNLVFSNSRSIDILIALDENTEKIHKKELKPEGTLLKSGKDNIYYAGCIFKMLGMDFSILELELNKIGNYEKNIQNALEGFNSSNSLFPISQGEHKIALMNGNEAISEGAIAAGIEFYYGYPMTPATGVLTELSQRQNTGNHITLELDGEISCVNAAIGSSLVGAKTMVGSSGGGFDLMTESLSLAGMAEIPLVMYLSQRPGPSTGLATYTAQGDLKMALHSGHGEFVRIVIAPGDAKEAIEKTSEIFYFTQKYLIPGILISDKHLVESYFSFTGEPKITFSEKTIKWPKRYNSYESDENKIASENPEVIKKNIESRIKKAKELAEEIENFQPFKLYGNMKSNNLIIGWGSTKGAILDAIKKEDCKFLHIIYLEPFSKKIKEHLVKSKNIMVVENNSTSPLSSLIAEKTGFLIEDKNKILRYDGRPFLSDELKNEISRRLI